MGKRDDEDGLSALRVALLNEQFDLRSARFGVALVLSGDPLGTNEVLRSLLEWMDARDINTHAFRPPTDEERERPPMWRFWRRLPAWGRLGVFVQGWTVDAMRDHVLGHTDAEEHARRIEHVRCFERGLVAAGTLLIKVWLDVPHEELARRVERADASRRFAWRVSAADRALLDVYEEAEPVIRDTLARTSDGAAPWHVLESRDHRACALEVARTIRRTVGERLDRGDAGRGEDAIGGVVDVAPRAGIDVASFAAADAAAAAPVDLGSVALDVTVPKKRYERDLERLRVRLHGLVERAVDARLTAVLVFEGWDAAGKGGVIRRLTSAMDARDYDVVRIAAPTPEELQFPFLWRFWRRLPAAGRAVLFDRSWYGRVLVERVEGLADEADWRRGYEEIVDFEAQLVEHGVLLQKFWLHLDRDEQERRFEARERTPYKKYKITADDYRNRARWDDYTAAVDEMVARTSAPVAWRLVAANDKRWARLRVFEAFCDGLEARLDGAT